MSLNAAARCPPPKDCVAFRNLVLNLSLRCPLRCDHCCYRSDMTMTGCLALPEIERAIEQAAVVSTVAAVHFVGGEPFLLPELMLDGIKLASRHGMTSAATTSAFFAKSPERAEAILAPMFHAGLAEITISYDEMHAAFIPEHFIVNAVAAARKLTLPFNIAVTVKAGSQIDGAYLRRLLMIADADPRERVYEVLMNSTGRAADGGSESATDHDSLPTAYRGACHSVLQNIQITHDGRIVPCCGVLPHADAMVVGHINDPGGLHGALRGAYADPIWKWIAFEGPVELLAQVTADDPTPVRPESFDGICTACDRLFSDPILLARVRQAVEAKGATLCAHEAVLEALGKFQPPSIGTMSNVDVDPRAADGGENK